MAAWIRSLIVLPIRSRTICFNVRGLYRRSLNLALLRHRCSGSRPLRTAGPRFPIEGGLHQSAILQGSDFARHLWLSCNKLLLAGQGITRMIEPDESVFQPKFDAQGLLTAVVVNSGGERRFDGRFHGRRSARADARYRPCAFSLAVAREAVEKGRELWPCSIGRANPGGLRPGRSHSRIPSSGADLPHGRKFLFLPSARRRRSPLRHNLTRT